MEQKNIRQSKGTHPDRAAKSKNNLKSEYTLRNLWNNIKQNNIHVIEMSEKEEERERAKKLI